MISKKHADEFYHFKHLQKSWEKLFFDFSIRNLKKTKFKTNKLLIIHLQNKNFYLKLEMFLEFEDYTFWVVSIGKSTPFFQISNFGSDLVSPIFYTFVLKAGLRQYHHHLLNELKPNHFFLNQFFELPLTVQY